MKKNVKYLGMAAAALLAVAPVVTTGVANAATPNTTVGGNIAVSGPASTSANAPKLTLNGSVTASIETKPSDLTSLSAVQNAIKISGVSGATIKSISDQAVSNAASGGTRVDHFVSGKRYWVQAKITITGLATNTEYNVNGTSITSNAAGEINTTISYSFVATDAAIQGQPYFADLTTKNHVNLANDAFVYEVQGFNGTETLAQLLAAAEKTVSPMVNVNGQNKTLGFTTTTSDIKTQLENQGITVTNNKISSNASSFYLTLSTVYTTNGKTASVRVQFNRNANDPKVYPAIYQTYKNADGTVGERFVKQGNTGSGIPNLYVGVNSGNASAFYRDPIGYLGLKAYTINKNTSGRIDLKVLSNNIDPNKMGSYPITISATNPNGYTTDLTFNVIVAPDVTDGHRRATVQYKPGYGVNIWNVVNSNSVSFSGKRQMTGDTVTIYGEKTVNGVKYYQINSKDSNEWIQAQYLDGTSADTTTKPSTDNKGEEAVSGVLTVRYDGKGKVGLTNANGQYVGQYVSKNSRWKVFAKKTINGREFYRIGNQNQWIPAQYSELD